MKLEKEHLCHGGKLGYYSHESEQTKTPMRFSLFFPDHAELDQPYVVFLSGLTCTEDNFTTKANAYKKAAELGLVILAPDTSPRGADVPDSEDYDLGQGAGFYIDATEDPWAKNFRMESYLMKELLPAVEKKFGLSSKKKSIMGHSMGGHGALTLFFKNPGAFKSVSAFSPIVAPAQVPWGHKAFSAYIGDNEESWHDHDACALVRAAGKAKANAEILIDQGLADNFLEEQLRPELFKDACKAAGQKLNLRLHDGYDHSYFFIQSFIDDHLEHHNKFLH